MKKLIVLTIGFLLITNLKAQDQTIKDYLDSYIGENAVPYIQPLSDLFASNINTGIWEWSNFDSKLFVRLKVQTMVSFPTESMRTFQGKTTGDFRPPQTVTVPTIIGDQDEIVLQGEDTTFYVFPGGFDLKRITTGTPQVTVGGFLHSEFSARFLSFPLGDDLGRVRFLGIGGRHSITSYFEEPPFDISIGYFYHNLQAGTYLDSDQHLISAHIGKSGKFFSGQVMIGYQTSDTEIHYTYEDVDEEYDIDLALKNENPWIFEVNVGLRLGPMFVSGAASYAKHPTVAAGIGLFF